MNYRGECIPKRVSNSKRKYWRYLRCAVPSYLFTITLEKIPPKGNKKTEATHTGHPNKPYACMPPI